jgi:hypothetical protein
VRQLIFRARETLRTGMGALVPIQILRMALATGSAEPVVAGAAGAGIGLTAAKLGLGAVLATGVVVAGVNVENPGNRKQGAGQIVKAAPESAQAAAASAAAAPEGGDTLAAVARGALTSGRKAAGSLAEAPREAAPPRPHGERNRAQDGNRRPPREPAQDSGGGDSHEGQPEYGSAGAGHGAGGGAGLPTGGGGLPQLPKAPTKPAP